LGRVVDYVLEEYITLGPISPIALVTQPNLITVLIGPDQFIKQASAISGTIQELQGPSHWVFYHRFIFVARYARLHEALADTDYAAAAKAVVSILSEDLAPRAWGAVILSDSIPLIRFGMSFTVFCVTPSEP
jgi:nuclear pore complex protein Nup85